MVQLLLPPPHLNETRVVKSYGYVPDNTVLHFGKFDLVIWKQSE